MNTRIAWCLFAVIGGPVLAEPHGGLEVQGDNGSFDHVALWWSPSEAWEGRWWAAAEGRGAAWFRAGGLQVGALSASQGAEGLRSWSAAGRRTTGHWGLGLDGESWGIWALQDPQVFEAGAQLRLTQGSWTLGAGADRSWALGTPSPSLPTVSNRGRLGIGWRHPDAAAGLEAGAEWAQPGGPGWWWRGRGRWAGGPWSLDGRGLWKSLPDQAPAWEARAQAAWGPWSAAWEGSRSRPQGQGEGLWSCEGGEAGLLWSPGQSWGALGRVRFRWGPVRAAAGGQAEAAGEEVLWGAEASVAAPWEGGTTQADWKARWESGLWTQTVTARWSRQGLRAEVQWRVEGLRLGWIGPGSEVDFVLGWTF